MIAPPSVRSTRPLLSELVDTLIAPMKSNPSREARYIPTNSVAGVLLERRWISWGLSGSWLLLAGVFCFTAVANLLAERDPERLVLVARLVLREVSVLGREAQTDRQFLKRNETEGLIPVSQGSVTRL